MKVKFEITEKELKEIISDYFMEKTNQDINEEKILIMVKSKQNYKSEWEVAAFKATFEGDL